MAERKASNYDEQRAARMLRLLMDTAPEQQIDTLAIVCRAWLDRQEHGWGQSSPPPAPPATGEER